MPTNPLAVDLYIAATGQRLTCDGRAAVILALVAAHAEKINAIHHGAVEADCTDVKVSLSVREHFRPVRLAGAEVGAPRDRAPALR